MGYMWSYYMPAKLVFGVDALDELSKYVGDGKILLVTGRHAMKKAGVIDRIVDMLDANVVVFDRAEENPSYQTVDKGVELLDENRCELVIGLGGGSAMDTAKMIALVAANGGSCYDYVFDGKEPSKPSLPLIAIPTTSGTGSEANRFAVISDNERHWKRGFHHESIYPDVSIIDPKLTLTMPPKVTANSGVDALAHAIESYWSKKSSPMSEMFSLRAIELVFQNLEKAYRNPNDLEARTNMSFASMLAGIAINLAGVTAAHPISHAVTAHFGITHGNGCLIPLPALMDYNKEAAPEKVLAIARASGASSIEGGIRNLKKLAEVLGLKTCFSEVGVAEKDIPLLIGESSYSSSLKNNPRELTEETLTGLLKKMI
ncbi:MAG: iron-containing alcohol dehydrogenase [Candidatus Diapherotrites archaeon]|nr:iron-containing alcohol dehydrogenase [Candidatus Diapherotrites archaeon]